MKRNDDFEERREHLKDLSDAELETRFWSLIEELIDPLLKLGYENTSPAIERSVLLRMGFSSLEAKALVEGCMEHNLMEHGAGNVVYRLSKKDGTDVRTAGLKLIDKAAWEEAEALFGGENA
jgi:D-ornithine 4,5-aminomutase subunit alpha